jgi:MoCo/4Fe-4S cofactor protein with predicted Tat translocation signal
MPPLKRQWRSVEELGADPEFLALAAQEFPALGAALERGIDRRRVLKLMAAALAMQGLAGCDLGEPAGKIVPAVRAPPGITPGRPNFYASVHTRSGFGNGIVVTHHQGRPAQVSGNPHHPSSLGAVDVFAAAMPLDFYDPDRNAGPMHQGQPVDPARFAAMLAAHRERWRRNGGAGLRILTGAVTSPTLNAQLDRLQSRYPQARWHRFEPCGRDAVYEGYRQASGKVLDSIAKPEAADVIVGIDSDLISSAPGHLRYAREFAGRRNPTRTAAMSRVYAIEPTPTLFGAAADHRFIATPQELPKLVAALFERIVSGSRSLEAPPWLNVLADDLRSHAGSSLVHIGADQAAALHALVAVINERLKAPGNTLHWIAPVERGAGEHASSFETLVEDMHAGAVDTLVMLDTNPLYAASAHLQFGAALKRVTESVCLNTVPNETGSASRWAMPLRHPWEDWSDSRGHDGSGAVQQPLAAPLFAGASLHEIVENLWTPDSASSMELVRETWASLDEARWHESLAHGVVEGSAPNAESAEFREVALPDGSAIGNGLALLCRPDPHVWDGRFANNPWLQELPRPLTKLTWDNPLLISAALAAAKHLKNGEHARLGVGAVSVVAPVWILPGQADATIVALLGFGRRTGEVAVNAGWNFFPFTGAAGEVTLDKAAGATALASTEHHALLVDDAHEIVRHGLLAQFKRDAHFLAPPGEAAEIYRRRPPGPAAWGMSIDLNACIGCNACSVACQSENNIPTVGKEAVLAQREMHWLRIDRYFEGTVDAPQLHFQPMLCMHCEQAPCETVCPVGATVHDAEGLNVMVYNRCIGTRFCSNNCPYKVRRFNYFGFAQQERRAPESRNPEVTVRARGVMEKCTFCIQRIAAARADADRDNLPIGEVRTACQEACPTRAITFGNLADTSSEVAERKLSALSYALLGDQNTHPRVTYEARIRNPNPALDGGS